MSEKPLILLGSARKDSDTRLLIEKLFDGIGVELVDLLDYRVSPYCYTADYAEEDDFQMLLQKMLEHKQVVFATPVYWYSMSGLMKTLFDRLTDIITVQKTFGRQMKGKETYVVAIGSDEQLPLGFEEPFRLTSDYFDMNYKGGYYTSTKALATGLPETTVFLNHFLPIPKSF